MPFFNFSRLGCWLFLALLGIALVGIGWQLTGRIQPSLQVSGIAGPLEARPETGRGVSYFFTVQNEAGEVVLVGVRNHGAIWHYLQAAPAGQPLTVTYRNRLAEQIEPNAPAGTIIRESQSPTPLFIIPLLVGGLLFILLLRPGWFER